MVLNAYLNMSNNKRIIKNTLFLYLRMLLIMGVSLYTSRVVLRVLGVEDFGVYNVVGGIVTMFAFLNGSLSGATSRFLTIEIGRKDSLQLNRVFNVTLIIHLFIALLIILLAETVGLWFFYNKMSIPEESMNAAFWVYQISILTSLFSLTQVPYNAMIIAHEDMKIYAYVGIVEVLAKLAIVYLLLLSPINKLIFYSLLIFMLQVFVMMTYRIYCRKKYVECQLKICRQKILYKEIFIYASSDMIGNISVLAQGQGLNILLNMFFGPVVNAARAIAYQVQGAITQFSNNFMTAVKPQIIKSYAEGNIDAMMDLVKNSSCFSYYLMWIISLPICLESDYILKLWLVEVPEYTSSFLILVIVLCLIQTIKTPRSTVFSATGRLKLVNIVVGSILCAAFPLAYIFLKQGFEPESVFIAAIITMLISEVFGIIILRMYIKYSIFDYLRDVYGRCILVTSTSLALTYYLHSLIQGSGFIKLITTCVITIISVVIMCYYFGFNSSVKNKIKIFIKEKYANNKITK